MDLRFFQPKEEDDGEVMLADQIKTAMFQAMKDKDKIAKEILRLASGEIQSAESRKGRGLTEAEVEQVLRKLIKSNKETMDNATDNLIEEEAQVVKNVLIQEIEVLEKFLPKTLSQEEIKEKLQSVVDDIREAKSDGQATGVAMKFLKSSGALVQGNDVSAVVSALRS